MSDSLQPATDGPGECNLAITSSVEAMSPELVTTLDHFEGLVSLRIGRRILAPEERQASIYRGSLVLHDHTLVKVIVKIYPLVFSDRARDLMLREVNNLRRAQHERILPSYGTCTLPVTEELALVMPYMRNGNLGQYLKHNPQEDKLQLLAQVADALQYLHDVAGVVHGDICQRNVFISDAGGVLLGGFGLSTLTEPALAASDSAARETYTLRFAAPELIKDEASDPESGQKRSKTRASDVYAFGMLILEVVTGEEPWAEKTAIQVALMMVERGCIPPRPEDRDMSDALWSLCTSCWCLDPWLRPSVSHVLSKMHRISGRAPDNVRRVREDLESDSGDDEKIERWIDRSVEQETIDINPSDATTSTSSASDYLTPLESPSREGGPGFQTGTSSAASRHRAAAPKEATELLAQTIACTLHGTVVDITLPKQEPLRGGMSQVLKGYANIAGTIRVLAVKICQVTEVMKREREIWQTLQHENVLPLWGVCEMPSWVPTMRAYVFVSPFMQQGNLLGYLKRNPQADRLRLMTDVAHGLSYLHVEKSLVHGDIKAENTLITEDGRALLADFGLSTTVAAQLQSTEYEIRQRYTLVYCAPEIVDDVAEDPSAPGVKRSKTKMSDMYAYGVLLFQTYAGQLGGSRAERYNLMGDMYQGRLPPRPSGASPLPVFCDDLWSICRRCWVYVPTDRPPIGTVLNELRELQSSPERQLVFTV